MFKCVNFRQYILSACAKNINSLIAAMC